MKNKKIILHIILILVIVIVVSFLATKITELRFLIYGDIDYKELGLNLDSHDIVYYTVYNQDIFVYTNGIIMSLILGIGMCLSMNVIGNGNMFVLGIIIGIFGIIGVSTNYFSYYLHYENVNDLVEETLNYINKKFINYFNENSKDFIDRIQDSSLEDLKLIEKKYLTPYLTFIKENNRIFKAIIKCVKN